MIWTVTLNPSLDYDVQVDGMRLGAINRTTSEQVLPGGKGVNVSVVLRNLGLPSVATGFVAGFTGTALEGLVAAAGVGCDFVHVAEGLTRINVKVLSDDETEVNGRGPRVTGADVEALLRKLDALGPDDTLVLSGSVPASLPAEVYGRIAARVAGRGTRLVVDAERGPLESALAHGAFLVKPNHHELGALFGVGLARRDEVVPYARRLQARGAANVLVSMGGEGAVLVAADGSVHEAPAPRGTVVNSVGAGDSMVAGFLAGLAQTGTYEGAFRMGLAAGSASAFSAQLATRAEVEALLGAW